MKNKIWISLLLITLGLVIFYWFQIRPTQIKNYCDQVAWKETNLGNGISKSKRELYDWKYSQCLHSQGLK